MLMGGKCCCRSTSAGTVYIGNNTTSGFPSLGTGNVYRYEAITGIPNALFATQGTANIAGIACDRSNRVFVHLSTGVINCYNVNTGALIWTATGGASVHLGQSIAVSPDGYVYTTSQTGQSVRKWDASNGTEITSGFPISFGVATHSVVCDQSNNIYVTSSRDASNNRVRSYTSAGTLRWQVACETVFTAGTDNLSARGLALSPDKIGRAHV